MGARAAFSPSTIQVTTSQLMSLFDMQSMEWTPAARLLALIAGMLTLSSSMLTFPCLTSCFYKIEPHTEKVCKSRRDYAFGHGSHILLWSLSIVGGVVAGAQLTCILLLPSLLAWTFYHYSAGGIPHAVLNFALTAAVAYYGFVPLPRVQTLEWTPAAIFLTIIVFLTVIPAMMYLVGGKIMDAQYEQRPYLKEQYCNDSEGLLGDRKSYRRARELAMGAQLLGAGCCQAAAIMSGGAQDMCLLAVLPVIMNGYCHWREEDKGAAIFCWIIAAAMIGFGIAR